MKRESALLRRIVQITWWVGLSALVIGLVSLVGPFNLSSALFMGAGAALLGINVLVAGELSTGLEMRAFTIRGPVVRGRVDIRAGLNSVLLGSGGSDRVAAVQCGPLGKPRFEVVDGVAHLRLGKAAGLPNVAEWSADLAGNVLWTADLRSWLGDQVIDLRQLRVEELWAKNAFGHMTVICPHRGYTRMHLRTTIGRIELSIPQDTGVRITLKRGALSALAVQNDRIQVVDKAHCVTPNFETASAQLDVTIETTAGDIFLT